MGKPTSRPHAGELAAQIEALRRERARLLESESRYRQLVEHLPDAVVVHCEGRIVYANPKAVELLGAPDAAALLGREVLSLIHPDDRDHVHGRLEDGYLRRKNNPLIEERVLRLDGGVLDVEVAGIATTYEGKPAIQGVFRDITERKRAEQRRRDSEEKYRLLAEHSTDLISTHTPEGVYTYASPAAHTLLGYTPEELVGLNAYELFHPDDLKAIQRSHARILKGPEVFTVTYRIRRKDGAYVWLETTSRTIRDADGQVVEIIAASRDVTERKATEEKLEMLANHDPLTAVFNRRRFTEALAQMLAEARRYKLSGVLLMLDLDGFKQINDRLGHLHGDRALVRLAKELVKSTRECDVIGRLGGDEFGVILPHLNAKQAEVVAARLLKRAQRTLRIKHEAAAIQVTASVGLALFPEHADRPNDLLAAADLAMYRAKGKGGNGFRWAAVRG